MFNRKFAILFVVASIVTLAYYTAGAQIVEDGLVSYWHLDKEVDDGVIKDEVGPNDGTIVGNPEFVEGKFDKALKFDGQGDAVTFPTEGFPTGKDAVTWSAWFKREVSDFGASQYVATYGPWAGSGLGFGVGSRVSCCAAPDPGNNDTMFMTQYGPIFDTWGPVLPLGEWHYVAAVYNGKKNNTMYVNGEEVASLDLPIHPNVAEGPGAIGGNMPGLNEMWVGLVDEVGLYNRALSFEETEQNFKATAIWAVDPAGKVTTTWAKIKARP